MSSSATATTTTESTFGSATEDILTTLTPSITTNDTPATTTSFTSGPATKNISATTTSLGFATKDTPATTTTTNSGLATKDSSVSTETIFLPSLFATKDTSATTPSSMFRFGTMNSSDIIPPFLRFSAKECSTTTTTLSTSASAAKGSRNSKFKTSTKNSAGTVSSPGVPPSGETSSKQNSESEESSPFYEKLEVAGTLIWPQMDHEVSKTCKNQKFTWVIREQPKRKNAYGIASEVFVCQQTCWRMCLYSFGFPTKVCGSSKPDEKYTFGPMVAIVLVPVDERDIREFYKGGAFYWILDVKLTNGDLLKRFHSKRYPNYDTVRDDYFVLPPKLASRIHCPSGDTLSVICELTLQKNKEFCPRFSSNCRIFEEEILPESEESLRGYHYQELVSVGPRSNVKYSWTIEDWPTRKCVLSKGMGYSEMMYMCLRSNDFSTEDVFRNNACQEPRWVLIGILPITKFHRRGVCLWNLDVKQIDGTPLKRFPSRRLVHQEDGFPRTECFVLPPELAQRVHSGNRFSVVCELALVESDDGVEAVAPSVESATQAQLISGIDGLSRDLEQLLLRGAEQGDCSDATVRVRGRGFPVHRAILSARTPVFASMFRHPMSERETGVVDVDDCEPETFQRFLQYAYAGRVKDLSPENASALYRLADKYQVEGLKAECLEFLKKGVSVRTVCETVALAARHGETELLELASDFFAKNLKDVILTVEWQNFMGQDTTRANELLVRALHGK